MTGPRSKVCWTPGASDCGRSSLTIRSPAFRWAAHAWLSRPLKVSDWHTDFRAPPSPDGLHRGFANALDSAWSRIEGAITAGPNTEQALFFTGHSLGGALALIAAEHAARDPAVNAAG